MPTGGTDIMIGLSVLGAVTSAYGMYQQGQAADAAGKAQQQEADYEAAQAKVQAGQERAAGQRKALQADKEKNLAESKAIALNAGSGGSSLDPSVVDILGDLEGQGTYNANNARYEAEDKARDLESGAATKTYQGSIDAAAGANTASSSTIGALGGLVSSGATMYGKYGDTGTFSDGSPKVSSGVTWNTGRYG